MTNTDRLKIELYKATLIGLILNLAVFFITVLSTIGLGHIMGKYSILFSSSIAAALMFLVNSLYLKMGSFKVGLAMTALLAFFSLPVIEGLRINFPNLDVPIALAVDPSYFFISWQTLAGLGISIGIWLKIKEMPAPNIL
ncbi:hypothetical protein A3841_14520 [Pontibacter flavimaris]|uniref:Uncharacterized protein n=1 Tax=Pontibacter flavimaris TaxID=1797110 RepID=A0A1Q5PFL6_9BACT|nr:hypothetical protein A3841_14520 [Pontibacter flavimaris]